MLFMRLYNWIHRNKVKEKDYREWLEMMLNAVPKTGPRRKDNRGLGVVELLVVVLLLASLFLIVAPMAAHAGESYHLTCYCPESCPGTITYSGTHVREGIAAVTEDHIGDTALIYTEGGEFLGIWECLDKIGTGHHGVIDIWKPDLESAKDMMVLTGGRVNVVFIKDVKG